ncbi:MAG: hypothetical protein ACRDNZ_04005 [Streptosporangiaceae bacterium]
MIMALPASSSMLAAPAVAMIGALTSGQAAGDRPSRTVTPHGRTAAGSHRVHCSDMNVRLLLIERQ